jgi:serine/threonine-protein kinase
MNSGGNPHEASAEWAGFSRLLDEALEREGADRDAWLALLAAADPPMAERVTRVLAVYADGQFAAFLAEPLPLATEWTPAATLVGRRVGAYQIDAQIARGGMGSVWRAHRVDGRYDGVVAVKFIHAAWVGHAAEARFRTEGNLLGRLSHPNIVRLLDAGILEDNQPYIVIEYVEGDPIDVHCERLNLGLGERTRLFLDVIAAVAHAHTHLIVHRDLKPANILVTRDGGVKLLDFGIAKLLDGDAPVAAGTTGYLMTPLYAAPEQLLGKPALTATDIYALGLVYYRLLTNAHPLTGGEQSNAELLSAVLTREPRAASAAAGIPSIRAQSLEGDLDTILGKALKKDPLERYESAASFADDIRRYLNNQPVLARPDTLGYRTGKFVRRHRGSVLTAVVTALALILTTVAALWQTHTARQERDVALAADRRADSMGDFLTVLIGNLGNAMEPQVIRPQFDHARELVEKQLYDDPHVKANLLRYLAGRYAELGDPTTSVTLLEEAQNSLDKGEDRADSAQLDCSIANFDDDLGRSDDADRHIRRAVDVLTQLGSSIRPQVRADCRVVESYIATARGENRRAINAARTAVAEVEQAGIKVGLQHDTVINALARAEARAGFNGTAVGLLRQLRQSDVAQGRNLTIGGWIHGFNEARDLLAGGRTAEAERLAGELQGTSRQFGGGSGDFHGIDLLRGQALLLLARNADAVPLLTRAVAHDAGPDARLDSRLALIEALLHAGGDAGRRELVAQNDRLTAAVEHNSAEAADVLRVWALGSLIAGDPQKAEALLADAARRAIDADGLPTAAAGRIATLRADVALRRGAVTDACRFADQASARGRAEAVDVQSSASVGEALLLHARCDAAAGRREDAGRNARAALVHLEANLGRDHPLTRQARQLADGAP